MKQRPYVLRWTTVVEATPRWILFRRQQPADQPLESFPPLGPDAMPKDAETPRLLAQRSAENCPHGCALREKATGQDIQASQVDIERPV